MALSLRRVAASALDGLLALLLAFLLASTTGRWLATRAASALGLDAGHSTWSGGLPLMLGAVGELAYGLPLAMTLVLLAEPLTGRTPGRARLGLALHGGSLWRRFAIKGVGAWGLTLALLTGWWPLTVVAAACGALALAGTAPLLVGRRPFHDVIAGTGSARVMIR